jgi:mRNA interferase MazF
LKGKIVLIPFPFTDLSSTKLRPALVLHESAKDVVVAFISSRTENPAPTDIIIDRNHPEFKQTGLKLTSTLKIDKIATISKELILGEIGEVGAKLRKEINRKITETYTL